jgi:hypothetical protein
MFAPITLSSDVETQKAALVHPYQEQELVAYTRNIIVPTTFDIALKKGRLVLLWLLSIYFISRHIVSAGRDSNTSPVSNVGYSNRNPLFVKVDTLFRGLTRQIVLTLVALFLLLGSMLITITAHDAYQSGSYFLQKVGLFGLKAKYQLIPPHEDLVKHLAIFPPSLPLVEIQIELNEPKILDTVRVLAPNGGEWTSRAIDPGLWGIVIVDTDAGNKILNDWPRRELMGLSVGRKLTLWIPNNGDLSKCPKFEVELLLGGGKRVSTIAGCSS